MRTIELKQGGHRTTFFVLRKQRRPIIQRTMALAVGLLAAAVGAGAFVRADAQGAAVGQASGQAAGVDQHTRIALVADVQTLQPGTPFTAGIVLTMDPGWHTYWKNPGESGIATVVRWVLPEGFSVGETKWPVPEKKIEEGDVLTFGYGGETMLLATITPPSALVSGSSVELRVEAEWLECERTCVPGSGTAVLSVPVSGNRPVPANRDLFAKYWRLIPKAWSDSTGFAVASGGEAGRVDLRLSPTGEARFVVTGGDAPDFFPEPSDIISPGRVEVNAQPTDVRLSIPLKILRAGAGDAAITGVVVYRLEGGEREGAVVRIPVPAAVTVGPPAAGGEGSGLLEREFQITATQGGREPLAVYFLFAIIGGLLLNIMPCVLPVIALKVFGLVRMAGDRPAKVRKLGWFFSFGILASFLVLALAVIVLKIAGQQVGWGFQFQEPLFVMIMCAVVFAFGLSLFGVYEIRLPGAAVIGVGSVLAQQEGKGKGYAASFSEGVFATILATPCTAPFLGSALGFAFSQPWWMILLIFTAVALGMTMPYLILTARPAWMKFLPKPGAWMESAKQFMGFLMMGTLLWLLYVLGKQLGMEAVVWTGAFLLTVGIACWVIGRFATLTASRRATVVAWSAAILAILVGYWFFADPVLKARGLLEGSAAPAGGSGSAEPDRIPWENFTLSGLEAHLKDQQPVFLDFTAEWCLTCKVNEKTVLASPEVLAALRSGGFVPVRADWTSRNPDITRLLAKFGRSGVPLYVIFPRGKASQPIVLPEVITPGIVLDAIARGR